MSKRNNLAELKFLFKIGLSCLINKLSLISRKKLLFLFTKMVNSSKNGILLQFKRSSRMVLYFDGLVFLNIKGDIPACSPDLLFRENAIRGQLLNWNNIALFEEFTILANGKNTFLLETKESLPIKRDRLTLNKSISSAKLFLFENSWHFIVSLYNNIV